MTASAALSGVFLQAAGQTVSSAMAGNAPAQPYLGPYSVEFFVHAAFIWIALVIICLIVFGYRKIRKGDGGGFPDVYQKELNEMRKSGKRS